MTIDDNVKQKLLDSLSKEPAMVISTAYAYAKNYVNYGEDITKAWTTATQQESVLQKVRQKTWAAAYDDFKADYKAMLKADKVAMLTEIQKEIEELKKEPAHCHHFERGVRFSSDIIQQKIDKLKEEV